MSRVRSLTFPSRRQLAIVAIGIVAVLVALALVVEPPASRDEAYEPGAGTTVSEPADGGTEAAVDPAAVEPTVVDPVTGEIPALADRELLAPERTAGGAAAPRAQVGISADEATSIPQPESALDAPALDARIIRTAAIELRLKRGGFEDGWGDAQSVAGAFGGYVVAASRSGAGDGPRFGTITLRVPAARFDAAVDRLRELDRAKVARLDVSSQDVTQEFVDVRSRLRHDRAVEGRLLALLARTEGVSEVLAVQARLDQVQEQIELSRGRLQYLDKLTTMSTIEVSLREPGAKAGDRDEDEGSVLGEAWGDARERFAENVAGAIVWLGGALPALVLLMLVAVVARVAWRRHGARRAPESTS